jgi:hypothetical protein
MLSRQYCPIINMQQEVGHHLYDIQVHLSTTITEKKNVLSTSLSKPIHRLLTEGLHRVFRNLRILLPRRLNDVGWDGRNM